MPADAGDGDTALLAALDALRECRVQNHAARALVLSPPRGTAAPLATIGLARLLSGEGRTILVDLNRDSPAVESRNLALDSYGPGDAEPLGLGELLAGRASFAEIIHRDSQSRLHVVPVGAEPVRGAALDAIDLVLEALGETYDYVVLHAPEPDDAVTQRLAPDADVAILVQAGERSAADLDTARAAMRRAKGPDAVHAVPASLLLPRGLVRQAA